MKNGILKFVMTMVISMFAMNSYAQKRLPPPQSGNDPRPAQPTVDNVNPVGVTAQAGVGGTQAYARAGVMELGGFMSFQKSDHVNFTIRPTLGYFLTDNWEISGMLAFDYNQVGEESNHFFSLLGEPSFHMPINEAVYWFAGLGFGLAKLSEGDLGLAMSPRVGLNVLVGRSGILSPQFLFNWSTQEVVNTGHGTLVGLKSAWGFGAGYTVMW